MQQHCTFSFLHDSSNERCLRFPVRHISSRVEPSVEGGQEPESPHKTGGRHQQSCPAEPGLVVDVGTGVIDLQNLVFFSLATEDEKKGPKNI